jgi:hypothetical protein
MFLMPWIRKAEKVYTQAVDLVYEIESYDEVAEVKERMRKAILNDTYQSLRHFFDREIQYNEDGVIQDHTAFWNAVFTQYLDQFLADTPRSQAISDVLWKNMRQRLDPENKGFLSAAEKDLPHIIMNMAEFYVPNMLVRGDFTLVERRIKEDAQDAV